MPADPEIKDATTWLGSLLGLGGVGILSRLIFNASRSEHRMKAVEKTVSDHGERLDATEQTLGILRERSEVAVRDRRETLESLHRIEARLR